MPYKLISDNGKQFDCGEMKSLCDEFQIQKSFYVVSYLQSNGQIEAVNKILTETIKKKLEKAKENWANELFLVPWVYNMTSQTTTEESPFSLAYGCEAMISITIEVGSLKRSMFDEQENEDCLRLNLDLVEEHKAQVQLWVATFQ